MRCKPSTQAEYKRSVELFINPKIGTRTRLALALLLIAAPAAALDRQPIAGQASVIDGDPLEIHGQRIRLCGIDASESRQLCGDGAGTLTLRPGGSASLFRQGRPGVRCYARRRTAGGVVPHLRAQILARKADGLSSLYL